MTLWNIMLVILLRFDWGTFNGNFVDTLSLSLFYLAWISKSSLIFSFMFPYGTFPIHQARSHIHLGWKFISYNLILMNWKTSLDLFGISISWKHLKIYQQGILWTVWSMRTVIIFLLALRLEFYREYCSVDWDFIFYTPFAC